MVNGLLIEGRLVGIMTGELFPKYLPGSCKPISIKKEK